MVPGVEKNLTKQKNSENDSENSPDLIVHPILRVLTFARKRSRNDVCSLFKIFILIKEMY